jgi:hypothetical protein
MWGTPLKQKRNIAFNVCNTAGFNPHKNQSIPALAGLAAQKQRTVTGK